MFRIRLPKYCSSYSVAKINNLQWQRVQINVFKTISSQSESANSQPLTKVLTVPIENAASVSSKLQSINSLESPVIADNKLQEFNWMPSPYSNSGLLKQYKKLSKFRLTSLVVITAMGGYALAPAPFDLMSFVYCSVGTGLVSAAANAINQYHEVPFDSQMSRTKNRALVMGQLTPLHAVGFACVSATAGLYMLYHGVNGLTAALGASNLFLYTLIYTPMKRMSILNTWIGSVVGAIPPLMGWAGCTGSLDAGAWLMAGVLYSWQFPHFNALSWNLRPDYSRAGYRMMAVTNPDLCRWVSLQYSVAIVGLSLLAPALDVTNAWFALETFPLNGYFCYLAYKFHKKSDSGSSRKLFKFSLLHLPALMLLFLVNKKHWYLTDSKKEEKAQIDDNSTAVIQTTPSSNFGNVMSIAIAANAAAKEPTATLDPQRL